MSDFPRSNRAIIQRDILIRIVLIAACFLPILNVHAQTVSEAKVMTARQLAERFLPVDQAQGIVWHEWANDAMAPQGMAPSSVVLFGKPQKQRDGICSRTAFTIVLPSVLAATADRSGGSWLRANGVYSSDQIMLSAECSGLEHERFANVQNANLEDAMTLLLALQDLQKFARGWSKAKRITCRSDYGRAMCKPGAHAAFSRIALDKAYIIQGPDDDYGHWKIAVMPKGPGNLFLDIKAFGAPSNPLRIILNWTAPSPF